MAEFEPLIVAFACNWCTYAAADLAGTSRTQYPHNVRLIRVMCSGMVDPVYALRVLEGGADGVLIAGCHHTDCHYINGPTKCDTIVERLKRKRVGSKRWDEVLMRVSNLTVLIPMPVVAGLDVGRFQWVNLPVQLVVPGFIFFVVSSVLINWAMISNPHFEPTVRIQKDRDHRVVTGGPYGIVRHPSYLGGVFFALSIPLIIGSGFAFIPAGVYVLLTVVRTWLEDETLQRELEGYSEYTERVRYRLVPWLW